MWGDPNNPSMFSVWVNELGAFIQESPFCPRDEPFTVHVDWGDGTVADYTGTVSSFDGTSTPDPLIPLHTYATPGIYTLHVDCPAGNEVPGNGTIPTTLEIPVMGPLAVTPTTVSRDGFPATFHITGGLPLDELFYGEQWYVSADFWDPDGNGKGLDWGSNLTRVYNPDGSVDLTIAHFGSSDDPTDNPSPFPPSDYEEVPNVPGTLTIAVQQNLDDNDPSQNLDSGQSYSAARGDVQTPSTVQTPELPCLFLFGGIGLGYTPDVLRTGLYEDQPCTTPTLSAGLKIKWSIPAIFQDGAYIQSDIGEQPLNQQTTAPTSSSGQALYVMVSAWTLADQYGADEWQHLPLTGQQILDMGGASIRRFTTPIGPTRRAVSIGGVWRAKYDMIESTSSQDLLQAADRLDEAIAVTQLLGEGTATVVIYSDAEGTDELHRFSWTWDKGGA